MSTQKCVDHWAGDTLVDEPSTSSGIDPVVVNAKNTIKVPGLKTIPDIFDSINITGSFTNNMLKPIDIHRCRIKKDIWHFSIQSKIKRDVHLRRDMTSSFFAVDDIIKYSIIKKNGTYFVRVFKVK